jgi:hypothetical protein
MQAQGGVLTQAASVDESGMAQHSALDAAQCRVDDGHQRQSLQHT